VGSKQFEAKNLQYLRNGAPCNIGPRPWNYFEVFQPMWSRYDRQTDRQTDRPDDIGYCRIIAR